LSFEIRIEDTGVGISEEGLKNLFVDFGKLKENSGRNRSGTGLGLSICKKIIEQMGGNVRVESELGKGTAFIVRLKTRCRVKQAVVNEFVELKEVSKIDHKVVAKHQSSQSCNSPFVANNLSLKKNRVKGKSKRELLDYSKTSMSPLRMCPSFQFINKPKDEEHIKTRLHH